MVNTTHTHQLIHALPKVELHRHLEGSVRLETLVDIAKQYSFEMPEYHIETLRPFVQMMPEEKRDWQHFLGKFVTLRQFYRSPDVIHRITYEAVEDAFNDNIRYMELRFTPKALSNITKMKPIEIVRLVCGAVKEACERFDIEVRLIVSMNRHESIDFAKQVLDAAIKNVAYGVVAVDLAGQEAGFPASLFRPIFLEAKAAGLGVTIHAGEWEGAQSIWDAIGNLSADRIGHGTRAIEDAGIVSVLAARGTILEVCPTSNFDTGVVSTLANHPVTILTESGVQTTLNTDDPLISNITLTDEMERCVTFMGWSMDDIKLSVLRSAQGAFLPPDERNRLTQRLKTEMYP